MVNNAGVDLMLAASNGELDTVRRVFDVNFFGTVAGTLAVLPGMVQRQAGIVVNVSSDSSRAPEPGQGAYAASKAAISAFSESVAHEVGPSGVHVHLLYPGWVPTAMGLSGNEDGGSLPPRLVRRTADGVAALGCRPTGGAENRHQRGVAAAAGAHGPHLGSSGLPESHAQVRHHRMSRRYSLDAREHSKGLQRP